MSTDAQKQAYKRYRAKKLNFAISYSPTDKIEGLRLQAYLAHTGQSANAYLKSLVKADLDHKGIAYPDPDPEEDVDI